MAYQIIKCLPSLFNQHQNLAAEVLHLPSKKHSQSTSNKNVLLNTIIRQFASCDGKSSKNNDNLAAVLHGIKDLRMETRPIPKFNNDQVLIQMDTIGICGTDVHFYLDGRIGPFVVKDPMIIGHEASGTVLECGKCVTNLKAGDKIAIEPQMSCRTCEFCKSGRYHLCPTSYFCANPPDDGNLCRYYVHDSDFCHKLPSNLDFEHGTLIEPLSCGVHACKRAEVTPGDSVLILGSGTIGLVSALAAKAYGASKVVVLDIDDFKIKKALEVGVDCAINIQGCSEKDIVKTVHDVFGHHPHKTIECCGHEQAMRVGVEATRSGGKLILIGLGSDNANLPVSECVIREVDILGVFRYVNDYPTAIDMVQSGKVDPKPLVTHHFKLQDSVKAFQTASEKKEPFIKILIHADPNWQPKSNKC